MKKSKILFSCILTVMLALVMAMPMSASAATTVSNLSDLQAAINDDGEDEIEITLGEDITGSITIPDGKTVVLNLNGKTLTNTGGAHTITVALEGTLTIKGDGTVDNVSHAKAAICNNGTVVLDGGSYTRSQENGISSVNNGGNSYYTLYNHGQMTINEGVTVSQNGHYSSMVENGYQNYPKEYIEGTNQFEPSLTINGGTFTGGLNTIKNDDNGKLTINGGTFNNVSQAAVLNWNVAEISGGTFNAEDASSGVILNGSDGKDSVDKGKLTISGGTFNGGEKAMIQIMNSTGKFGNIVITGGEFAGDRGIVGTLKDEDSIEISGGKYTVAPSGDYIAEDSVAISFKHNSETNYYIGTEGEINSIISSAESGDEIEILSGDINLKVDEGDVKITNKGDGSVVANGTTLNKDYGITTVKQNVTNPDPDKNTSAAANATAQNDNNVKTSDDFNPFLFGGIALAALIAIGGVALTARKQN